MYQVPNVLMYLGTYWWHVGWLVVVVATNRLGYVTLRLLTSDLTLGTNHPISRMLVPQPRIFSQLHRNHPTTKVSINVVPPVPFQTSLSHIPPPTLNIAESTTNALLEFF